MSEVKNEGLEVVAMLTVSFDEGDGGSAIEQVETHTLLDEGAHDLCRHSEALAGYAVRDARIATQEAQIKALQSGENSWQSGYDEGRSMGGKHCTGTIDQLRAELAASSAKYLALIALAPSAPLTVSAPVSKQVVLPERRTISVINGYRTMGHNEGWNACLDEIARLNAADQEGGQDE